MVELVSNKVNEVIFQLENSKLRLRICSEDIIHVTNSKEDFYRQKSLLVVNDFSDKVDYDVVEKKDDYRITTTQSIVKINKHTGLIEFFNRDGKVLTKENSRAFTRNTDVKNTYQIKHLFETNEKEAFYGLGGYQKDVMNYSGERLLMVQSNHTMGAQVCPLLVSTNDYGILWDNYSDTEFGANVEGVFEVIDKDVLFDKDGNQGGLTASFYEGNDFEKLVKVEKDSNLYHVWSSCGCLSDEHYEYSSIRWEGKIKPKRSGKYIFKATTIECFNIYVDSSLIKSKQIGNRENELKLNTEGNEITVTENDNSFQDKEYEVELEAGKEYNIRMELSGRKGRAMLHLKWLQPTEHKTTGFFSRYAAQIDYYFIHGKNIDTIINNYRKITGTAPLFSKWVYGFFQSKERYKDRNELASIAKKFRKKQIPIDCIVQDWRYWGEHGWSAMKFDEKIFNNPSEMLEELHDMNYHLLLSIWPGSSPGTDIYNELKSKNYLLDGLRFPTAFGEPYNPFIEEAADIYWRHVNEGLFKKGVDAWWMDGTEPGIGNDVSYDLYACKDTEEFSFKQYLNTYALKTAQNVYIRQRKESDQKRVFILTRSSFAGQQRNATVTWTGDTQATWEMYKIQIACGLNFCISGIPYWTHDIGGFFVNHEDGVENEDYRELYTRWYQFGAFSPIFRSHGTSTPREIWNFGEEGDIYYDAQLIINKLRYRLMPYIYSTAWKVTNKGYTLMRALVFDFKDDEKVYSINNQYMFGPSILVNPVIEPKAVTRKVYLPKGTNWYDFYTNEEYGGEQVIDADAPINKIPLFIKAGSIIPIGPDIQHVSENERELELKIYPGHNCSFTLYYDEGDNYNYEKGHYATIDVKWDDGKRQLMISDRVGSYKGMLEEIIMKVDVVGLKHKPVSINYIGEKITFLL